MNSDQAQENLISENQKQIMSTNTTEQLSNDFKLGMSKGVSIGRDECRQWLLSEASILFRSGDDTGAQLVRGLAEKLGEFHAGLGDSPKSAANNESSQATASGGEASKPK